VRYKVIVSANISTAWEADSMQEAVQKAENWTAENYGDLIHKANFEVTQLD
jgi:hypothetical protein